MSSPATTVDHPNRTLITVAGLFLLAAAVPWAHPVVLQAVQEAFLVLGEYAREHVLLCLVPAFFIAGAIMVFLDQGAVIRYLGPDASRPVAYGVAAVSGTVLAVCSCTVLPIFKGIYRKGAGIGPAVSFLYSGPAINVLAIILTAKVLGPAFGVARAVGAIVFAAVIGLLMQLIFFRADRERTTNAAMFAPTGGDRRRSLARTGGVMAAMIGVLVFLNWAPSAGALAWWDTLYRYRYAIALGCALFLGLALWRWYSQDELRSWADATRTFAVQILPLLFAGVFIAGFLLGRPGHRALIPESIIAGAVGENTFFSNLAAAAAGALMYFATLTEIPIMQGLLGAGMHDGPALALLLAGPSLSLPSLLIIGRELGFYRTGVYVALVIMLSTVAGFGFGVIMT